MRVRRSLVGNNSEFKIACFEFRLANLLTNNSKLAPQISKSGFSLVELIAVIAVLALAIGVAGFKLNQGLDGLYLRSSAKDILVTLRYAREKAIAEQMIYKVGFDVEQNQFYLADEIERKKTVSLAHKIRFKQVKIDDIEVRTRQQTGAGFYLEQTGEIFFFPTGSSNKGEITVENTKGSRLKISTDFLTGAPKIS